MSLPVMSFLSPWMRQSRSAAYATLEGFSTCALGRLRSNEMIRRRWNLCSKFCMRGMLVTQLAAQIMYCVSRVKGPTVACMRPMGSCARRHQADSNIPRQTLDSWKNIKGQAISILVTVLDSYPTHSLSQTQPYPRSWIQPTRMKSTMLIAAILKALWKLIILC